MHGCLGFIYEPRSVPVVVEAVYPTTEYFKLIGHSIYFQPLDADPIASLFTSTSSHPVSSPTRPPTLSPASGDAA